MSRLMDFDSAKLQSFDGTEIDCIWRIVNPNIPYVILVNSVGMPFEFFDKVADTLTSNFNVISWECRGNNQENHYEEQNCSISDQVKDLEFIYSHFGITKAHLVGWCIGVQVATKFCISFPQRVMSLSLVNGQYNHPEFKTPFENTLATIVPVLAKKPKMADFYCKMLAEKRSDNDPGSWMRISDNKAIIDLISAPYKNGSAFARYAKLVAHALNTDLFCDLSKIPTQTLLLSEENDRSTHCQGTIRASQCIPNSKLIVGDSGGHFAMYETDTYAKEIFNHIQITGGSQTQDDKGLKYAVKAN